ncbi:MAG: GMC family oxidoreductase [Elusimicrobia bacterium]|nr:GMC family oxidoreductase [Elusimicrobiota bacterium]
MVKNRSGLAFSLAILLAVQPVFAGGAALTAKALVGAKSGKTVTLSQNLSLMPVRVPIGPVPQVPSALAPQDSLFTDVAAVPAVPTISVPMRLEQPGGELREVPFISLQALVEAWQKTLQAQDPNKDAVQARQKASEGFENEPPDSIPEALAEASRRGLGPTAAEKSRARQAFQKFDADFTVIGSGYGGAISAYYLSKLKQAGKIQKVKLLERGQRISRENFEPDADMFWAPERGRFGPHHVEKFGPNYTLWAGSVFAGGSPINAATHKRWHGDFGVFHAAIHPLEMELGYGLAEKRSNVVPYPIDTPPYSQTQAIQLLYAAGERLQKKRPDLIEDAGVISQLAMSFATEPGQKPGQEFTNEYGAKQRYSDPRENSILGGDLGAKNTLDKNWLFLAEKQGIEVETLTEVEFIEPLQHGGYRIHFKKYNLKKNPNQDSNYTKGSLTTRGFVLSAGAIGSTKILLNSQRDGGMDKLSPKLGKNITTNGNTVTLLIPIRGSGLLFAVAGLSSIGYALFSGASFLVYPENLLFGIGAILYYFGIHTSPLYRGDDFIINQLHIQAKGLHGEHQGAYAELGSYSTPGKTGLAFLKSTLKTIFGPYRPRDYEKFSKFADFLQKYVPPFGLIARLLPLVLLMMGKDVASGEARLDENGKLVVDYPIEQNKEFYQHLEKLGKAIAKEAGAIWLPNFIQKFLKHAVTVHTSGGVPMGENPNLGVVDDGGRIYGYDNAVVADGSFVRRSPGLNPLELYSALTIRAWLFRLIPQWLQTQTLRAEAR